MRQHTWARKTLPPHQIVAYRQAHGITSLQLEAYLGLAEKGRWAGATVENWESGRYRPEGYIADALKELNNWIPLNRVPNHPDATPARIVKWREEQGLTQVEAARVLKVTPQTVSNWEGGRSIPKPYLNLALAYLTQHPEEIQRRI